MSLTFTSAEVSQQGTSILIELFLDGDTLTSGTADYPGFGVSSDAAESVDPLAVVTTTGGLILYLDREVKQGEVVTVSYAGGSLQSNEGSSLDPFSSLATNSSLRSKAPSAQEIFDYFTASNRQNAFKADVSGLATTAQLDLLPKKNIKYRYTNYFSGSGIDEVTITDTDVS